MAWFKPFKTLPPAIILLSLLLSGCSTVNGPEISENTEPTLLSIKAQARYLNLPVAESAPEIRIRVETRSQVIDEFDIHLAEEEPDYYVFLDLAPYQGEIIRIDIPELPADSQGPELISIDQRIKGSENLYSETWRQQVHFSSRRGWNNDPNGLFFLDGEYHLYYQHNPYGWDWGNMHWGHAVSTDLVHWEELPIAIYPASYGDWAFSGSAIVDTANLSGFQSGEDPVVVAAYTSTARGEVIAYSNDKGRSFKEYEGNPVIEHQGRDPKLIWYEPDSHWVAAVYHEEDDQQWIAFYSSPDLKNWKYQSKIKGFYECPELFELKIEGSNRKKWILYAADGDYMIGEFNGKSFTPETEKIKYSHGDIFYASQTFNNIPPRDGRRIQVGWGRIESPGMPFNQCMLFPVDLTLRETRDGLRLTPRPIREIEKLHQEPITVPGRDLDPGSYQAPPSLRGAVHLQAAWEQKPGSRVTMVIAGHHLIIDSASGTITLGELTAPIPSGSDLITLELIADRLSLEIFLNNGEIYMPAALNLENRTEEYALLVDGKSIALQHLQVWPLQSIWTEKERNSERE